MITLRPDQAALKAEVYDGWNAGHKNMLAVLPTGGGKSVIVSDIVLDRHNIGARQCVIAHRNELVGQMSLHVARRGIKHRIIASAATVSSVVAEHRAEFNGRSFINPDANCTVSSVDTLIARQEQLKPWAQQIDDWTIDEAHHVLRLNKWGKAVDMFPNAKGLGVTATPARADGMGLGRHVDGVFDAMCVGPSMRELIDAGALCNYQIVVPESDFVIDDSDVAASGDWSPTRMREASKKSHIVGDVVKNYQLWAYGKRFICFATDVETAGEMAQKFNDAGIPCASVSAKTPAHLRNEYIRRFRAGQLWGLVNVDLFGEGFDVPAVEVVIMARPTASLAVYLQQFGRALRVLAGKAFGLVIDHVSNWKRHGLPDKAHYWSLDRRDKRGRRDPDPDLIDDLQVCRDCSRPFLRVSSFCPFCGWQIPLPEPSSRTVPMVEGDLTMLTFEMLAQMRQATQLESPADIGARVGAVAGPLAAAGQINRQIERYQAQQRLTDAIAQWAGIQRYKGRTDSEAHRRFYAATGVDVISALAMKRADMDALATKVEGWCVL